MLAWFNQIGWHGYLFALLWWGWWCVFLWSDWAVPISQTSQAYYSLCVLHYSNYFLIKVWKFNLHKFAIQAIHIYAVKFWSLLLHQVLFWCTVVATRDIVAAIFRSTTSIAGSSWRPIWFSSDGYLFAIFYVKIASTSQDDAVRVAVLFLQQLLSGVLEIDDVQRACNLLIVNWTSAHAPNYSKLFFS
jgi:hypothetical protein